MRNPDRPSNEQQRVDDPRSPTPQQAAAAPQQARVIERMVDPYDMRMAPTPEEPGYGHGV